MGRLKPVVRGMVLACAFAAIGCGTQSAADLFTVNRTGALPGADLKLVVNDAGEVRCNGSPPRRLPDNLLLDARELTRDLARDLNAPVPQIGVAAPTYMFKVTLGVGEVKWPVGVPVPESFSRLVFFTRKVAKGVCGLSR